ncbi:MAG: DUF1592 domain-containing protein [Verrucomicrobiota bacterium JB023]|nr:DUF1592 domain-containing protein [Verrucomicrobiota bacterium JB023]
MSTLGHVVFLVRALLLSLLSLPLAAAPMPDEIDEILDFYCYDCHGYGKKEGDIQLDSLDTETHREHWERAWLNVRTGMMPPADGEPWMEKDRKALLNWLERGPLGIDRENPDPGRVTIRRLNRQDYRHTIRDLLGIDFNTAEEFPPDDTGYGFDNIGDVLTISPLLAERYLEASRKIMDTVIPDQEAKLPEYTIRAPGFVSSQDKTQTGRFIEFSLAQTVTATRFLPEEGDYRLDLRFALKGPAEASQQSGTLILRINDDEVARKTLEGNSKKNHRFQKTVSLPKGEHRFSLEMLPGRAAAPGTGELGAVIEQLSLRGPAGSTRRTYPQPYLRVIPRELQPAHKEEWSLKSREVIKRFTLLAWRRPADAELIDRLTAIADEAARRHNSFEAGIRQAGTAILTSPRFLLRKETALPLREGETYPLIDEWSLANRLSAFLWNSMPDQELRQHAAQGTLRENLTQEVNRMIASPKSQRFVRNFVGQWLLARDVESIAMRPERVLKISFGEGQKLFNRNLRKDMRRETEALFNHVLQEKLPAIELVSGNYTFLNERLAKFYGISGVRGEELRKVEGSRGGLLTQGTFLVATSNPTRTSPVKRGLFVLDNLLGTPPPPAPPDVPELEEAGHGKKNLSMRERMVEHRKNPDCRSCHQRMDPIGLAFENFTAIGTWRDRDGKAEIDPSGELVTGESFSGVDELKQILATKKRADFHRCLAEKLLTYALGRGVEYYDAPAIDEIVRRVEAKDGALHEAIHAIVDSVPFQRTRG